MFRGLGLCFGLRVEDDVSGLYCFGWCFGVWGLRHVCVNGRIAEFSTWGTEGSYSETFGVFGFEIKNYTWLLAGVLQGFIDVYRALW